MSALPNMSIVAPCDPLETESATWACAQHTGPVYLRLGKAGEPDLTSDAVEPFQLGKLRLLKDGKDVCIISYGPITKMAFDVAARVEQEQGCSVAVVCSHTLKPLDVCRIAEILEKFETVLVVENHSVQGGLGWQLKQLAWEWAAKCKLHTFALKDEFIHGYGTPADLWNAHGLNADRLTKCLLEA